MPMVHRKSSLSVAISAALFAAFATSAAAASQVATQVDSSSAQATTQTAPATGQAPDGTITDALQRVTGVQINRDAGVGTSVDVRGLPEVGTMLNGEVFITP